MYHAGGDYYQEASAAAFERDYQHEGWVLAEPEPVAEPVAVETVGVEAEGESAVPPAEAPDVTPPKRGARAK